jgi:hypothetical protein
MALHMVAALRLGLVLLLLLAGMAVSRASEPASPPGTEADARPVSEPFWKIRTRVWDTRPQRLERPLRTENISDAEVSQIQAAVRGLVPGATVNIGGVTLGCPCEDGAGCTEQVWVVAYQREVSRGLMLSRIQDRWQIGPLQGWWLEHDALHGVPEGQPASLQGLDRAAAHARLQELFEAFPHCPQSSS